MSFSVWCMLKDSNPRPQQMSESLAVCACCRRRRQWTISADRRITRLEHNLVRQLVTEAVPFAFEKCLADVAVQNWGDNIQSDILSVRAAH